MLVCFSFFLQHALNRQASFTVELLDHMGWYLDHIGLFFSHHSPQSPLFAWHMGEKEKRFFLLHVRTCKGKSKMCSLFSFYFMNLSLKDSSVRYYPKLPHFQKFTCSPWCWFCHASKCNLLWLLFDLKYWFQMVSACKRLGCGPHEKWPQLSQ